MICMGITIRSFHLLPESFYLSSTQDCPSPDPDRRTLHPLLVAEAQDESGVTGKHLYSNKYKLIINFIVLSGKAKRILSFYCIFARPKK